MDVLIFKTADSLHNFGPWQQIVDRFRMLNETQQKWVNHLVSFLCVLAPLLFLFFVITFDQTVRSNVSLKEQLLHSIENLSRIKGEYLNLERLKISRNNINSQEEVEALLKKTFQSKSINWEKITISNFQKEENAQGLVISNFRISFTGYTNSDINQTLSILVEREKAAINNISIRKDLKDNTLTGQFDVTHYSKGFN